MKCTDPLCELCFPDVREPEEMGWGWPYLILLGIFVLFVILWMVGA
ncbi:hypothetical protein LCGC14_2697280 [marine sediment metagenome]|uniref:Uncharacterized protein n=1 Tax=marine sediment metagenome TaxID=412755 RepID=A0A0F9A4A9_9ZZZZ